MPGAIATVILPASKLNSLDTETLLLVASRALYEVRRRTGSDQEFISRSMAARAVTVALAVERDQLYPNDDLVKDLTSIREAALVIKKAVR